VAFVAIYDACVLFPNALRDFLVRLGMTGLFRARWTAEILDETFRNVAEKYPDLSAERLARTRALMTQAVPDCMVTNYEELTGGLVLPDPDDRHVLAAAIRSGAQVIVTFNLRDFPPAALARYGVEAQHPDDFVFNLIGIDGPRVAHTVEEQAAALKNPPVTADGLLDRLQDLGLAQSVAALRPYLVLD
jgi:predicted nucleic acid-binding protein